MAAACVLAVFSSPAAAQTTCSVGTVDKNVGDAPIAPKLGTPLVPRRADGRPAVGFNDYAALASPQLATYAEDMALHRRVGSTLLRVNLQWGHVERNRNVYQWYSPDLLYCSARNAGITPLFIIVTSPSWATAGRCSSSPCSMPPAASYDFELKQFATLAAIRYPGAVFEVWNEPNLTGTWGGTVSPSRYVQVLRAVYQGIKNGSPSSVVLGGGLSNNGFDGSGRLSLKTFLRGMYSAGAKSVMDGVSIHPYPVYIDPSKSVSPRNFDAVNTVLAENGELATRHVWATEVGASTAPAPTIVSSEQFTPTQQKDALWRVYDEAGLRPNVDAMVFHALVQRYDPGYGWIKPKNASGKFYSKPVYCGFAYALGSAFDCSKPIPLN